MGAPDLCVGTLFRDAAPYPVTCDYPPNTDGLLHGFSLAVSDAGPSQLFVTQLGPLYADGVSQTSVVIVGENLGGGTGNIVICPHSPTTSCTQDPNIQFQVSYWSPSSYVQNPQHPWSQINLQLTAFPGAQLGDCGNSPPGCYDVQVTNTAGASGQGFFQQAGQPAPSTTGRAKGVQISPPPTISQSPSQLNVFTGDMTQVISTSVSPSTITFTPAFAVGLTSNPNSSCPANVGFSQNGGTGQVNTTVTAGPYICSGVFNALAVVNGTTSSNATTVVVPPEAIIEQMLGSAFGFVPAIDPGQIAQRSISVAILNRFTQPANFFNATTWQAMHSITPPVIEQADFGDQRYTPSIVANSIANAAAVFAAPVLTPGDPTLLAGSNDLIRGATCYWSPLAEEIPFVQAALSSGTTTFPVHDPRHPSQPAPPSPLQGLLDPQCYPASQRQIVWKTGEPNNFIGRQNGAPAYLFEKLRTPDQPAVIQIQ